MSVEKKSYVTKAMSRKTMKKKNQGTNELMYNYDTCS